MKFTPEVIAALQVLRDNATNDFERHRIDVLERDLTAPPTAEVIDDTHQKFDGVVYHKTKGGHFSTSTFIHRAVWQYYHGEIPCERHIHHIDQKPANNDINNLVCLSKAEHQALHMANGGYHEKRKDVLTCKSCGKKYVGYRSGNNAFCSEECRKKFYCVEKTCEVCGKTFTTRFNARYCSYKCRGQARHVTHDKCLNCGKEVPRTGRKYCSQQCYHEHKKYKPHVNRYEERTCIICGKTFKVYKYDRTQTCSTECAMQFRWLRRRQNNSK